jgi:hypothetical protein
MEQHEGLTIDWRVFHLLSEPFCTAATSVMTGWIGDNFKSTDIAIMLTPF